MVNIKRGINQKYLFLIVMLLVYMIITQGFMQFILNKQEETSKMLNLGGRQRMLSQRLSKNLLMENWVPVLADLDELKKKNQQLLIGGEGVSATLSREVTGSYREMGQILEKIEADINCSAPPCDMTNSQKTELISSLNVFLEKMDETMRRSQVAVSSNLTWLSNMETFFFLLGLFGILMGYILIVAPLNRRLVKHVKRLSEQQKLSDHMQKVAKIGWWELDLQTETTTWSDQIYEIHKVPVGEKVPKEEAIKFYAEKDRPRLIELLTSCIEEKKINDGVFEFYDREGNHRWVRSIMEPVIDRDESVSRLIGVFQDITEQKEAEHEIALAKTYFELAIDGANLGIWDWDLRDDSVQFDANWASMLGLDIKDVDMNLKTWEALVHPDDLPKAYEDITAYMEGRTQFYENIHRMKHADGHWVYILDRGRFSDFDSEGKPIRFTGTHFDVTEAQLMQEDQRLILANTAVGLWKWDIKNNKLIWDESMYQLYGVDSADFTGAFDAWEKTVHPEHNEEVFKEVQDALASSDKFESTFPIITNKGVVKQIGARGHIERDSNGEPERMYGINWDRTKEVEAENELEEQKSIAFHNAKLASIGELAAGVGHEINNPLAILKGHLDVARLKLLTSEDLEKDFFLKIMKRSDQAILRISNIVKGLRTFSRDDVGTIDVVDLGGALLESVDMIQEIYLREGITIMLTGAEERQFFVKGNRGKIQQVILSLVSNAKDACKTTETPLVKISLEATDEKLIFAVSDNGVGIAKEIQDRIFNPFFTTKDLGEGTGIGLSLAHSIVQDHSGDLRFETSSKGTKFYCELPRLQNIEALLEQKDKIRNQGDGKGRRILVVDDEVDILEYLQELLKDKGFEVDVAATGAQALEKIAASQSYHFILSDRKMPELDGVELCSKAKTINPSVQFILMTGGVEPSHEGNEITPDATLLKPFGDDDLFDCIAQLASN